MSYLNSYSLRVYIRYSSIDLSPPPPPQRFQQRLVRIQQLLCFRNLTYATGAINSSGIGVNYPYLRLARLSEGSVWRHEEGRRVKRIIFTLNA